MKIEMLETVLHDRQSFESGEVRIVSDDVGTYFCERGWAKDIEGKIATGERDITHMHLAPENVVLQMTSQTLKGA